MNKLAAYIAGPAHMYPSSTEVYLASDVDKRIAEFTNEVELLNDVCERKQERLDKANTRIEKLEKALRDVFAALCRDEMGEVKRVLRTTLGL